MTQPDPMNNTIRCPLRARLRMALLALLLVSAGCGAETLNVGDPDAGSTGSRLHVFASMTDPVPYGAQA